MSEAEVEVVRRAAGAWTEGGIEAMRRLDASFEEDLEDRWIELDELIDFGEALEA